MPPNQQWLNVVPYQFSPSPCVALINQFHLRPRADRRRSTIKLANSGLVLMCRSVARVSALSI
jgi:hypothetical protein